MVTFPSSLAPSFFDIEELPSYGLKVVENEVGREVRRFTEVTGHNTRLSVRYSGMTSIEVSELVSFYQSVKGTFGSFTLPPAFYLNPNDYNIALALLDDTTNWRFESPPRIDTVVNDLYTTDFSLISLKEEEAINLSTIFGITQSPFFTFNPGYINYIANNEQIVQPTYLMVDTNTLKVIEIQTLNPLQIMLNIAEIVITSSRGLKQLNLSNIVSTILGTPVLLTNSNYINLNLPSVYASLLERTNLLSVNLSLSTSTVRPIIIRTISTAVLRYIPNQNLPDDSPSGVCSLAVQGYWAEEQLFLDINFGLLNTDTLNVRRISTNSNILLADINLGTIETTKNLIKYKGAIERI